MYTVAAILFFLSLGLILYTYAGYPVLLYFMSRIFGRDVRKAEITPSLSIIIAAYNEERDIARKLDETLALDYPQEKMEIIVASDCSSDRTDEIVRSYAGRGVILHRRPQRRGKTSAQNHAVQIATGEILIFSDATTWYEKDALRKIVRGFADPEVGAVTGNVVYVDRSASDVGLGARSYWGYEFFLKQCESRLSSLLGVCGCLYAVRRSSYVPLDEDMSSDFVIASEIYRQGQRTVYDPEAVSCEDTNKRGREEFWMRVRIIEQTMSALQRYRQLLNPFRHSLFAWQMISHKVMRYIVPFLLILAFEINAILFNAGEFYQWAFLAQVFFYSLTVLGWAAEKLRMKLGPLAIPYYFTLSNAASLVAFVKFLRGQTHVTWEPLRVTDSSTEQSSSQTTREEAINGNLVR
jgi:cellulose synthase/poly-beta-1,6-N-acetylglucosamine synthase-like glycosyltransferase